MTDEPAGSPNANANAIAVVGMAFRFPGASDSETFWDNLARGVESIRTFGRDELIAAGLTPELADDPRLVSAHGALEDIESFDADFFGYAPSEAALIDPQQRLFLECAYEALENAGIVPGESAPVTGVFGGCGVNFYLIQNVAPTLSLDDVAGVYQSILGGEKDFLTARVAYKLGLRGPTITVQSACATSLVAIHVACQSLLNGECDLALSGGVSLRIPQPGGMLHSEGSIYSSDGHCRAFDAAAAGTASGSGGGIVVLKRLDDALRDRDRIEAVILGSAVTNDGSVKLSFTAPAVRGQAAAIAEARAVAGVEATSIGYAEMHGTGTILGDPIEIAAMRDALGDSWRPDWLTYIGSLKTNVGHLDTAAGVAGLIKTILVLRKGQVPPTLHYTRPNPKIDFASGPLRVAAALEPWPIAGGPRRATVSSFGLGGNNCHLVMEAAPEVRRRPEREAWRLFPLSAQTPQALDRMRERLAGRLEAGPEMRADDTAWTLVRGRQRFARAGVAAARSTAELAALLRAGDWQTGERPGAAPRVAFLFPGQGAQRVGFGGALYAHDAMFRTAFDACADALIAAGGPDVRALLFREPTPHAEAELRRTVHAQTVLFALGYALAEWWKAHGVVPGGVLGHSSGEYAAAVCAGVLTLPDAARGLMARAQLMDRLPPGAMAAVVLSEAELRALLPDGLDVAAVNAPSLCTVAGSEAALAALEARLAATGTAIVRLPTAHAFHSPAVEPILPAFRAAFAPIPLHAPDSVAFYSAVTGARGTPDELLDAEFWVRQIRRPVLFGPALQAMADDGFTAFIELGPGTTLTGLVRRAAPASSVVVPGIPAAKEEHSLLRGLGRLWLAGCEIEWDALFAGDEAQRIALPPYPFERVRHWIDRPAPLAAGAALAPGTGSEGDEAPGLFVPTWTRTPANATAAEAGRLASRWLVVGDDDPLTEGLVARLRAAGAEVARRSDAADTDDYAGIERVLLSAKRGARAGGFRTLAAIARGLARRGGDVREIAVLTAGGIDATGGEPLDPWQATLLPALLALAEEFPGVTCRGIDLDPSEGTDLAIGGSAAELARPATDPIVALRHGQRWTCRILPAALRAGSGVGSVIKSGGTYLITGGLGALGLTLARRIAAVADVRLALVGRSPVAPGSTRARAIAALEAAGATVHVYHTDCTDRSAMEGVVADLRARYGRIDGVIHAAGTAGGGAIALRSDAETAAVLDPKTVGTEILVDLLAQEPLDFLALFSSLAAYMPVAGQADYAAANAFLDATAARLRRAGVRATAIDWDAWRGVGMAVDAELPAALRARRDAELAATGLDPERACETLWRVLAAGVAQVAVSRRRDFSARSAERSAASPEAPASGAEGVRAGLAQLWSSLLGVAEVRTDDDFFALGGHSLLATSIVFQIRQRWNCAIGLDEIFTNATFGAMAALLETRTAANEEREEVLL